MGISNFFKKVFTGKKPEEKTLQEQKFNKLEESIKNLKHHEFCCTACGQYNVVHSEKRVCLRCNTLNL